MNLIMIKIRRFLKKQAKMSKKDKKQPKLVENWVFFD